MERQALSLMAWAGRIIVVAALYVATGKIGFNMAISPGNITVVWPPSGIALAALLVMGFRVWPGIWLGSFLVNSWFFAGTAAAFSAVALSTAGAIAVGSTVQALLGAWLIRRFVGPAPFERVLGVFQFFGIATAACLFASHIGVTSMALAGFGLWEEYRRAWWTWWLGDLTGIVIVAPLLLAFSPWPRIRCSPRRTLEVGLLVGLALAAAYAILGGTALSDPAHAALDFVFIPLIVWAAFRFGVRGVVLLTFVASLLSVWTTVQGHGPFAGNTLNESLGLLQAFVAIVTITGLALAAAVVERERAEAAVLEREKRFRALIEKSSDAIALIDQAGVIRFASPSTPQMLGYDVGELVGRNNLDLIHPDDQASARALFAEVLQAPAASRRAEYRVLHKNGSWRWKEGVVTNLLDESAVRAIVINYRDATERKEGERARQRYAERLQILREIDRAILASQSPAGIARAALRHLKHLVPCDRASVVLFDFASHEGVILAYQGNPASSLKGGMRLPLEAFDFGDLQSFAQGQARVIDDVHMLSEPAPVINSLKHEGLHSFLAVPLLSQGKLSGALNHSANRPAAFTAEHVEIAREVADLLALAVQQARLHEQVQQHAAELEVLAMRDPLTGIPNRLLLYDRLQQTILKGQRDDKSVALFILDVDRFKEINDTLGHHAGDQVLKEICARFRQALRESDTLARLGGDEFAVILPDTDMEGAARVAKKILRTLDHPFQVGGQPLDVKASLGIALCPEHGVDRETLLRHADRAMYQAKKQGTGYSMCAPP